MTLSFNGCGLFWYVSHRSHPRTGSVQTSPSSTPVVGRRGRQLPQLPPKGTLERSKCVVFSLMTLTNCSWRSIIFIIFLLPLQLKSLKFLCAELGLGSGIAFCTVFSSIMFYYLQYSWLTYQQIWLGLIISSIMHMKQGGLLTWSCSFWTQ